MKIEVGDRILLSPNGEIYIFRNDALHGSILTNSEGFVRVWGYTGPIADAKEVEVDG